MTEATREFHAPQTITPENLGDDLARLVWESFTDFVSEGESESALSGLGLVDLEGEPDQRAVEEALIFVMWAHTRGAQQAFVGRAPADLLKGTLDALHSAVFEDMVETGPQRPNSPSSSREWALATRSITQRQPTPTRTWARPSCNT